MTGTRAQRRLAAILAADVVGYSRLIGADEAGTLAALRDLWATRFNPAVAEHRGRIVKMMGDGALVEFPSAVDAVDCAIAIQRAMTDYNSSRSGRQPIELRIGVNSGDIVIDGDDIFGDGVNVAARLEGQAPKTGILVSDVVYAQIRGKISAVFVDAGELALKNIEMPVRAWRWDGEVPPVESSAKAPTGSDDMPSIAVLPFTNMSGDPEQEYFSDGITEDIITDLSKIAGLMVVARNSSFAYKNKSPDVRTVGRELGVMSVLEGSIRRAGSRVRITAQLIDATTGGHLWAERYDRDLTDIFALQDEVTQRIIEALRVKLRPETALLAGSRKSNVEAHDCFLLGRELLLGSTKNREVFDRVVATFRRAIELDPGYSAPYAGLGMAYCLDFQNHWANTPDALDLARHFVAQAIEKSPNDPYAHYVAAVISIWKRDLEGAKAEAEKAPRRSQILSVPCAWTPPSRNNTCTSSVRPTSWRASTKRQRQPFANGSVWYRRPICHAPSLLAHSATWGSPPKRDAPGMN
ncbi:MAG: guanylyl cyclase [Alphaproteobacteria bacterium]|nr:MAG: guanylyl cyclase [Alphaproteobacteria bacterium]